MDVERANPSISGFPKPLPTHRLRRVQSAVSFYAAFRPLFRLGGRWSASIPCGTRRIATAITKSGRVSLQLGVLRLGLLQNGDVGVGVFPEGEKILVCCQSTNAGSVGISTLRGSRLQGVGTRHSQTRQRSRPAVPDDAAVVDDLLKLGGGSTALSGCQICHSAHIRRIEAGNVDDETNLSQLEGGSSLQGSQGSSRILLVQCQLRLNRRQPKRLHLGV